MEAKYRLLWVPTLFLLFILHGFAEDTTSLVVNPEFDFANTTDAVLVEYGLLRNEEILRLDLDIDGNGKSTAFFTYRGSGSKCGPVWTSYFPMGEKLYQRTYGLQFRMDLLRAGKVPELNPFGGLLVLYPGKDGGDLVRYRFKNGQAQMEKIRSLNYANLADRKIFESIFMRKLDEPMSAEYFEHPPYKVLSASAIKASYVREGGENSSKNLTSIPGQNVISDSNQSDLPRTTPNSQKPLVQTEFNRAEQPSPSSPVRPWAVGLLLLAVMGGVWWKFLRK